jgi:uncharacterized membrane protein YhaH (DUF805 family)
MGGYMSTGQYLFGFHGRINRARIWLFLLISIVAGIVLSFFDPQSVEEMKGASLVPLIEKAGPIAHTLLVATVTVANLVLLWATIAVTVKRLHDRNMGAIWLLVFWGLPCVCLAVIIGVAGFAFMQHPHDFKPEHWMLAPIMIAGLIAVIVTIWSFVVLYCLAGTRGSNRYGVDPLADGPVFCEPGNPVYGCTPKN